MTPPDPQEREAPVLPCPFCGETLAANNDQRDMYVRRYGTHYSHSGMDCYLADTEVSPSQVESWNRRAAAPAPIQPEPVVWIRRSELEKLKRDGHCVEYLRATPADDRGDAQSRRQDRRQPHHLRKPGPAIHHGVVGWNQVVGSHASCRPLTERTVMTHPDAVRAAVEECKRLAYEMSKQDVESITADPGKPTRNAIARAHATADAFEAALERLAALASLHAPDAVSPVVLVQPNADTAFCHEAAPLRQGDLKDAGGESADLLPCPFCGGEAVYGENHDPTSGECGMHGIGCAACGAGTAGIFACGDDPKPRLVELWNRRALCTRSGG